MTPDTPLLFFWTACLWALARLLDGGERALVAGGRPVRRAGDGQQIHRRAALVRHRRSGCWSRRRRVPGCGGRRPGSARCSACAVFLPVVLWEARAWLGRASPGRAAASATGSPTRAARFLGELLVGQIGLATPLVFVLCAAGIVEAARQAWRTARSGVDAAGRPDAARRSLLFIAARAGRPGAGQLAGDHLSRRRDRRRRACGADLAPPDDARPSHWAWRSRCWRICRRASAAAAARRHRPDRPPAGRLGRTRRPGRGGPAAGGCRHLSRRTSTASPRNSRARCRADVTRDQCRWTLGADRPAARRHRRPDPASWSTTRRMTGAPSAGPGRTLTEIGQAARQRGRADRGDSGSIASPARPTPRLLSHCPDLS